MLFRLANRVLRPEERGVGFALCGFGGAERLRCRVDGGVG